MSNIIRNELYTNMSVRADGDSVYFYNSVMETTQRFSLSDGMLCMDLGGGETMPLLGSGAYSSYGLALANLSVAFEEGLSDFGYGSFHIRYDVKESATDVTILTNDFYAMALNPVGA